MSDTIRELETILVQLRDLAQDQRPLNCGIHLMDSEARELWEFVISLRPSLRTIQCDCPIIPGTPWVHSQKCEMSQIIYRHGHRSQPEGAKNMKRDMWDILASILGTALMTIVSLSLAFGAICFGVAAIRHL